MPGEGRAAVIGVVVADSARVYPAALHAQAAAELEHLRAPCQAGCTPTAHHGGPDCRLGAKTRARLRAARALARAGLDHGPAPVAVPLEVWAARRPVQAAAVPLEDWAARTR